MKIQIDNEIREATELEANNIETQRNDAAKVEIEFQNRQKLRNAALAKLGLTADEITALFG